MTHAAVISRARVQLLSRTNTNTVYRGVSIGAVIGGIKKVYSPSMSTNGRPHPAHRRRRFPFGYVFVTLCPYLSPQCGHFTPGFGTTMFCSGALCSTRFALRFAIAYSHSPLSLLINTRCANVSFCFFSQHTLDKWTPMKTRHMPELARQYLRYVQLPSVATVGYPRHLDCIGTY